MFWAMRRRKPTTLIVSTRGVGLPGSASRRRLRRTGDIGVEIVVGDAPRRSRAADEAQIDARLTRLVGARRARRAASRPPSSAARPAAEGAAEAAAARRGVPPGGRRTAAAASAAAGATVGAGWLRAGVRAAGRGESGRPGASMRMSSAPTASTSPTAPPSAMTAPATGVGISTVALSVITEATTSSSRTRSPTLTSHSTISASATPSPTSGILIERAPTSRLHRFEERASDPRRAGEIVPFLRMRIRRVPARDPLDRRLERIETALHHLRGELGAEARGQASPRAR